MENLTKEEFEQAEIKIVEFETEDVITTSLRADDDIVLPEIRF